MTKPRSHHGRSSCPRRALPRKAHQRSCAPSSSDCSKASIKSGERSTNASDAGKINESSKANRVAA